MKFASFLENMYFGVRDPRVRYSEPSPDDALVKRMLDAFLEASKDFPPDVLEALGHAPKELLDKLRAGGFFGLTIPREYGGQGLTLTQYLAVVERIVRVDMALGILSLAHLSIGMKGIVLYGDDAQKKKYLPPAASGDMIFCYALTEPLIGSDAKNITTNVKLSPDGKYYLLNGVKTYITNANYAGGLTVFAQMEEKPGTLGAFIVETAWDGVSITDDMKKMGLAASSTASIKFTDVRVPKENLIGAPGDGFKIAMTILNYGRLALGAASSGMLAASHEDMMKRASKRIQFERPISSFELVQEKIVRAFVNREVVSAMTYFTAGLLEDDPLAYAANESSHTKLFGTNRAWDSLYDAMQTAGGAGFLKTQPYEKRMRDFRVATIFEGTTEIHSIYPPLALARNVLKMMRSHGGMFFLIRAYLKPSVMPMRSSIPEVRSALRAAKRYLRLFRRMFIRAFIRYGRSFPEKEFLLRRLTSISVSAFGLIALAAKIEASKNTDMTGQLAILRYYRAETESMVAAGVRLAPDALEREHASLFRSLKKG